jgi:hypothetical protein
MAFSRFDLGVSDCDCNCTTSTPCTTTLCATGGCAGVANGITISVSQTPGDGGAFVGSCVTGSNGCCSVTIPEAGLFSVAASVGGFTSGASTQSLECGGTTTIEAPVGWSPCVGNTNNIQFSCDLGPGGPQTVSFDLVWDAADNQWFGEQDVTLLITPNPLVMPLSVRLLGDTCEADISLCVTSSPNFTAITILPASSCSPFQLLGEAQSGNGCLPPGEGDTIFAQNIVMTQ